MEQVLIAKTGNEIERQRCDQPAKTGEVRRSAAPLLWNYLAAITIAEATTAAINPVVGMALHALLLLALLCHSSLSLDAAFSRLALTLTLAPMIRILSLSLPLVRLPQIAWYPIVAVPLLISAYLVMRQLGLRREEVGLRVGRLWIQLLIVPLGFVIGVVEYAILRPQPLIAELSLASIWLPALALLIGTGFSEEFIFRGVMQRVSAEALGRWGILYVSLLFMVLHIGYFSLLDLLVVFLASWLFAWLTHITGSILGVTLAHGLANTTLFVLLPFMGRPEHPYLQSLMLTLLFVAGLLAVALISVLVLARHCPCSDARKLVPGLHDHRPC